MRNLHRQPQVGRAASVTSVILVLLVASGSAANTIWTRTDGPPAGAVRALVATTQGVLYAAGDFLEKRQGAPSAGLEDTGPVVDVSAGVFRSADQGHTWQRLDSGLLQTHPLGASIVTTLGAVEDTVFAGSSEAFYRLAPDGSRWQSVDDVGRLVVRSIVVSGRFVYVAAQDAVYGSSDGGNTWRPMPPLRMLECAVADGRTLYAADGGANVYRTDIDGAAWQCIAFTPTMRGTVGSNWHSIRTLAFYDGWLYAGAGQGVFRTPLSSIAWEQADAGLTDRKSQDVMTLYPSVDGLLAGTGAGLYRWTEGVGWEPQWLGETVRALVRHDSKFYAGTSDLRSGRGYVFRSFRFPLADGRGTTWGALKAGR